MYEKRRKLLGNSSPRLYVLFRIAVPNILPVTSLPFIGLSGGLGSTKPITL